MPATAVNQRTDNMAHTISTLSIEDYSGEIGTMSFYTVDLTGANYADTATKVAALAAAVEDVIQGEIRKITTTSVDENSVDEVTTAVAQRETKWFVQMTDTTQYLDALNTIPNPGYGKKFNLEIPTAMLENNLLDNTEEADLSTTEFTALVDAIEAVVKSPWNYHKAASTVRVDRIFFVARNS
jgi:hypothetical protein